MNASPEKYRIGEHLYFFSTLDSTNTMAHRLAMQGITEGSVVIADTQTRGRGRLERTWQSPPARNLYLSLVLRPPIAPSAAPQLTLMAGVAVAELLSSYCPGKVTIKWPNDVLVDGKKICGILTEMKSSAEGVDFVILGIGININMAREDFDVPLRDTATSLSMETGATVDRLLVAGKLFEWMEIWYRAFLDDGFLGVRDRFLAYTDMVGRKIQVIFKEDRQTGEAAGIDVDGTILMKDHSGAVVRVTAGDVLMMKG